MNCKPEGVLYTCPVCNKEFLYKGSYIYKLKWKKHQYAFCGYTCYNKVLKLKEDKQHDAIHDILSPFAKQVS